MELVWYNSNYIIKILTMEQPRHHFSFFLRNKNLKSIEAAKYHFLKILDFCSEKILLDFEYLRYQSSF